MFIVLSVCSSAYSYNSEDVVPGELIVKFKRNQGSFAIRGKLAAQYQLQSKKSWSRINLHHFKAKKGDDLNEVILSLKQDSNVEFVEPNFYVYASDIPNAMTSAAIRAPESWGLVAAPSDINSAPIVAVIDSGIDLNHEVYNSTTRIYVNQAEIPGDGIDNDGNGFIDDVSGWNFINNSNSVMDDTGHGTHVSGIVVGSTENIFSFNASANARVRILPLRFLDKGVGKTSDAIEAINYALEQGAKVINNSWGGPNYSSTLHSAFNDAYNDGVVVVAAAGNSSSNNDVSPIYPANLDIPSLISVAASTSGDNWASFSNYGPQTVNVFAPGVGIASTALGGGEITMSGTSMAAPFVAGLAALTLLAAPNLSGFQVKELILNNGDLVSTGSTLVSSGRRINFESTVIEALNSTSEPTFQPDYTPTYNQGSRGLASSTNATSGLGCGRVTEFYEDQNQNLFQKQNNNLSLNSKNSDISLNILFLLLPLIMIIFFRHKFYKVNTRVYERKIVNIPGQMILDNGWVLPVHVKDLSSSGAGIQLLGDVGAFKFGAKSGSLILNLIFSKDNKMRYKANIVRSTESGFVGVKFTEL